MLHSAMDLNLIYTFIAIYESGSVSGAAVVMSVSQPTVSKRLSALRTMYKDDLFLSSRNGIKPSEYAHSIYHDLKAISDKYRSTLPEYRKFDPLTSNKVFEIGVMQAGGSFLIKDIVQTVRKVAPNVVLRFHMLTTNEVSEAMEGGKLNMIIAHAAVCPPDMCYRVVGSTSVKIICSANHPRIDDSISESEYKREKFAALTCCNTGVSLIEQFNAKELFGRNIACTVPSIDALMSIVESTDYLALLFDPAATYAMDKYNINIVDIPFCNRFVEMQIIWDKASEQEPANRWLRDLIALTINSRFPFHDMPQY